MVSLESRCAVKNGALEAHPVWGYKNIKGGGVGVGRGAGAENRWKISVVLGLVSQKGNVCMFVCVRAMAARNMFSTVTRYMLASMYLVHG